jgi:selenocysteine lyase/cysteine desulfurase
VVLDPLAEVRALFDPAPGTIYLDTATYGLPPRPTVEAMHAALDAWQAGSADWVHDWDMRGEACRAAFASLTGLPACHIALMPSASVGVGTVASTLTHTDEVVMPDDEFHSVLFPILVAQHTRGTTVRQVAFDRLPEAIGPSTTLVAFSLVQSQSGRTARQSEIVAAAERVGARTLIDASHAVPFVPVDRRAQFVVCAAYKHLLSPRGVAFFAVSDKYWDRLPAWHANWRSTRNPYAAYYGGPLDQASTAARFDVSLAWHAWAGAAVSMGLLDEWQRRGLLHEPIRLARRLAEALGLPQPQGTVVSVPVQDAETLRADLGRAGIKAAVRAGSVRLSTHVYNTQEHIDQAVAALERFVPQLVRP